MTWISENQTWLFEGLGAMAIIGIVAYFWKKKGESSVSNTISGNNNTVAGRDVNNVYKEDEKKN